MTYIQVMSYTLLIVESPAKCAKIEKYLGAGYKCMASFGHICELNGLENIDVSNNFKPKFTMMDSKRQQISKLRSAITKAKEVMLAADDDREGEAIAWHICQVFDLPVATTKRIIFHEITEPALKQAVSRAGIINMDVVHAQHARQVLDVLVGYRISPILWQKISQNTACGLSAGRCQTPALRLIYDNQKEIEAHLVQRFTTRLGTLRVKIFRLSSTTIMPTKNLWANSSKHLVYMTTYIVVVSPAILPKTHPFHLRQVDFSNPPVTNFGYLPRRRCGYARNFMKGIHHIYANRQHYIARCF